MNMVKAYLPTVCFSRWSTPFWLVLKWKPQGKSVKRDHYFERRIVVVLVLFFVLLFGGESELMVGQIIRCFRA